MSTSSCGDVCLSHASLIAREFMSTIAGGGVYWSCGNLVCPHRAIVNLLQPVSTQRYVGPMRVLLELLSAYFNLPEPSDPV